MNDFDGFYFHFACLSTASARVLCCSPNDDFIGDNPYVCGAGLRENCEFRALRPKLMQIQNLKWKEATACHLIDG